MGGPVQKAAVVNFGEVSFVDAINDMRERIGKQVQDSSLEIPAKKPGIYDYVYFGFIYKNKEDGGKEWVRLYTPIYDKKSNFSGRVYITETMISNLNNATKVQLDALQGHILNTPGRSLGEWKMMRELATSANFEEGYNTGVIYRFKYGQKPGEGRKHEYFPIGLKVTGQLNATSGEPSDVAISKPTAAENRLAVLSASEAIAALKRIIQGMPIVDVNGIDVTTVNSLDSWLSENLPAGASLSQYSKEERQQLRDALKQAVANANLALLGGAGKSVRPVPQPQPPVVAAAPPKEARRSALDIALDEAEAAKPPPSPPIPEAKKAASGADELSKIFDEMGAASDQLLGGVDEGKVQEAKKATLEHIYSLSARQLAQTDSNDLIRFKTSMSAREAVIVREFAEQERLIRLDYLGLKSQESRDATIRKLENDLNSYVSSLTGDPLYKADANQIVGIVVPKLRYDNMSKSDIAYLVRRTQYALDLRKQEPAQVAAQAERDAADRAKAETGKAEKKTAVTLQTTEELKQDIRNFVMNLKTPEQLQPWSEASDVVNEILRIRKITVPLDPSLKSELETYASNEIVMHSDEVSGAAKYDLEDLKTGITVAVNGLKFDKPGKGVFPSEIVDLVLRQKKLGKEYVSPNDKQALLDFAGTELVRRLNEVVVTTKNPANLKPEAMDLIKERMKAGVSTYSQSQVDQATAYSVVRSVLTTSARDLVKKTGIIDKDYKALVSYAESQLSERKDQLTRLAEAKAVAEAQARASAMVATGREPPVTAPLPPRVEPATPVAASAPVSAPPIVSLTRESVSIQDVAKSFTGSYTPGQLLELNHAFAETPEARKYKYAYHIVYQKQNDACDMVLFIKQHGSARIHKYSLPTATFEQDSANYMKSLRAAGASSTEAEAIASVITRSFVSNLVTGETQSITSTDRGIGNMAYLSLGKQRDEYKIPKGMKFSELRTPYDYMKEFSPAEDRAKYLAPYTERDKDYTTFEGTVAGSRFMMLEAHRAAIESAISAYKERNPEPLAKLLLTYAMEGKATSAPSIKILSVYLMYRLQKEGMMDFTGIYTKINGKAIKPLKDADDILRRARTKSGAQEVFAILQDWENRKIMQYAKEGAVAKLTEILDYAAANFMNEKPPLGYSPIGKIRPYLIERARKDKIAEVNPVDGKLGPITLMTWMFVMTAPEYVPPPPSVKTEEKLVVADFATFVKKEATVSLGERGSNFTLQLGFTNPVSGKLISQEQYLKQLNLGPGQYTSTYYCMMFARDRVYAADENGRFMESRIGEHGWFVINPDKEERDDKQIAYSGYLDVASRTIFKVEYDGNTARVTSEVLVEGLEVKSEKGAGGKIVMTVEHPTLHPWDMPEFAQSKLYTIQEDNPTFIVPNYGMPSSDGKTPAVFLMGDGTIFEKIR